LQCPPYYSVDRNGCSCKKCDECQPGYYSDPYDCATCLPCPVDCCPDAFCLAGEVQNPLNCACEPCQPVTECPDFTVIDPDTHCGCIDCVLECLPLVEIPNLKTCMCEPVNITVPIPPPTCDKDIDKCGVCGGDNQACTGCDGEFGSPRFIDACGVACGDGTTCPGCVGDRCSVCSTKVDLCGVCGGDDTSCIGCDGLPPTVNNPPAQYDICGVCAGNGTSCLGCDGKPNTDPCPTGVTTAQAAAVASTVALAGLAALALAAILLRLRKKPGILFQAWDDAVNEYITEVANNPIFEENSAVNNNPMFAAGTV